MSPIPTFTGLGPYPTFDDVVRKINALATELRFIMLNMDSLNVVSLKADHIDSGTIDANIVTIRSDLTSGAYVQINGDGMTINNGTYDTFTADISGNVTMTGATVQSTAGYPKVVLDPSSNLFGVYGSATNYIILDPTVNPVFNAPEIGWVNGGSSANIYLAPALLNIQSTTDISLETTGTLDLDAGTIRVPSWSTLRSIGEGQTLPQYINGSISGYSGVVVTPDFNLIFMNGLLKSVT